MAGVDEPLYGIAFRMQLRHGYCVGVRIPTLEEAHVLAHGPDAPPARSPLQVDWPIPERGLTPDERARAVSLRGYRRPDYVAGRLALRAALAHLGVAADTIGVSERGAPIVPPGTVGSISHKRPYAIALAAFDEGWTLGVDIEQQKPTTMDIARRVLTAPELAELDAPATPAGGTTDDDTEAATRARMLAVLRRFSIKEAVYKAIDPYVRRYVGFREVTVYPDRDGAVRVEPHLDPSPPRPLAVHARVIEFREFFISSARARTQ